MDKLFQTNKKDIVLVLHKSPDTDAVASAFVVIQLIKRHNPKAKFHVVSDFGFRIPFPKNLNIPELNNQIHNKDIPSNCCVVILDHSSREFSLLSNGDNPKISQMIVVDHHRYYGDAPSFAKFLLDPNAFSTCDILYDYLERQNFEEMTPEIATAIYIGMFSDSLYGRKPLKMDQFRKIVDLNDNHGADIEKYELYVSGRYFMYKKTVCELIFLCCSKSKRSNCVTMTINNEKLEKRINANFINTPDLIAEILMCKAVNHVITRGESRPGCGNVRLNTKDENLISLIENIKPYRPQLHIWRMLKEEEAKRLVKNIRDRLARGEAKKIEIKPQTFINFESALNDEKEEEKENEDV